MAHDFFDLVKQPGDCIGTVTLYVNDTSEIADDVITQWPDWTGLTIFLYFT